MSESNPLLSNATMQGAAKHIESLMDTNGVIKEPQKEAAPVEPKEPEAKANDNQEVQQQPEENLENKIQETLDEEEASTQNADMKPKMNQNKCKYNTPKSRSARETKIPP